MEVASDGGKLQGWGSGEQSHLVSVSMASATAACLWATSAALVANQCELERLPPVWLRGLRPLQLSPLKLVTADSARGAR
jgi:hypothetical protein